MVLKENGRAAQIVQSCVEDATCRYEPIDDLVFDYRTTLIEDGVPSAADYKRLGLDIRQGNQAALKELVTSNLGLVAAIAHRFKEPHTDQTQFLNLGSRALVEAVITPSTFNNGLAPEDHIVQSIQSVLRQSSYNGDNVESYSEVQPMEQVHSYVLGLKMMTKRERERRARAPSREIIDERLLSKFTSTQQKVLKLIHLRAKDISIKSGIPFKTVRNAIDTAKDNPIFEDRPPHAAALAIALHKKGMKYRGKKPKKALDKAWTVKERLLARNLDMSRPEHADFMNMRQAQISSTLTGMKRRSGARSRVEAALMSRIYDTGELPEIESPRREMLAKKLGLVSLSEVDIDTMLLERNTVRQASVISAYYLSEDKDLTWKDVAKQHNIDVSTAQQIARRAVKALQAVEEVDPS